MLQKSCDFMFFLMFKSDFYLIYFIYIYLLINNRIEKLSLNNNQLLLLLINFIENHLIISSQEKRSLSFILIESIIKLCPNKMIHLVLTKSIVKFIYSVRIIRKHTLYSLCGNMLNKIVKHTG